ncbi:hypothetical protein MRX96_043231 [Rhipicephalus microplus]
MGDARVAACCMSPPAGERRASPLKYEAHRLPIAVFTQMVIVSGEKEPFDSLKGAACLRFGRAFCCATEKRQARKKGVSVCFARDSRPPLRPNRSQHLRKSVGVPGVRVWQTCTGWRRAVPGETRRGRVTKRDATCAYRSSRRYFGKSLLSSSAASAVVVMGLHRVDRASWSRATIAPPRWSHPRAHSPGLKRGTTNVTSESVEYFAESRWV